MHLIYQVGIYSVEDAASWLRHRHDGIRSIENKKFPIARTKNKPRSNQEDGSDEVKINIPLKIAKR